MSQGHAQPSSPRSKRLSSEVSNDGMTHSDSKRQRISQKATTGGWRRAAGRTRLPHTAYNVGWICALPIELAASHALLDRIHEDLPTPDSDTNAYILGNIGTHNVVMACLPSGQYGTNNAASVASNMIRSFPSIQFRLLVGIGGGVPGTSDIRLGDVVVGDKVIQHDLGKINAAGGFEGTGDPVKPPHNLLKAVSKLRAIHEITNSLVPTYLREMHEQYSKLIAYTYPDSCEDRLFSAEYEHDEEEDCADCNQSKVKDRSARKTVNPAIHYGGIASGNQVVKCGRTRDALAKELDVICFEMEAAGMTGNFPCIVIRGICDYADSHKNKQWQKYAAATAAAYAKELVSIITPRNYNTTPLTHPPGISTKELHEQFDSRRQSLLKSLEFAQIDHRRETISAAHANTCSWLLHDERYKEWTSSIRLDQHHGFMWISGKPGAGKSTIMKFVLSRVKSGSGPDAAIASFFFHARGSTLEKSTFGLYRSLLCQILERFDDLQTVLDDLTLIPYKNTGCPTIDTVRSLLRNSIMALGQRQLTCFVDALDECDEAEVRGMVVYFEALVEEAMGNGISFKICFSSRHYPHIDVRHGLKLVLEAQPGHSEDLEKYVKSYLRAGTGPFVDKTRAQILAKAGGVFLWVVLVVEILNKEFVRGRRFRVEQRLNEIPTELSDLFRDVLRRDDDDNEEFLLCIQWILFAARPLKPREFYHAMLSGLLDWRDEVDVDDPDLATREVLELFVTSSSKGLAEITKSEEGTVQFIHESVKDFFIKDGGLQDLWPGISNDFEAFSHEKLKECCYSYITPMMMDQGKFSDGLTHMESLSGEQTASEVHPFLRYAVEYVLYHADNAAEGVSQECFMSQFPFKDWVRVFNSTETRPRCRYTPAVTLVYILAERNFINLLQKQVSPDTCVHQKGERYEYPFFAALANCNFLAAKLLLGTAATKYPFENVFSCTPLHSLEGPPASPIHWAIDTDQTTLTKLLINSGEFDLAVLQLKYRSGEAPIHKAALRGHTATVALLIEHGVMVDSQCHPGRTPLHRAIAGNHAAVARLLIQNGATIDGVTRLSHSPLHEAAAYGRLEMAKLLIQAGAVIDRINGAGWTALHQAAYFGHDTVIQFLINEGASRQVTDVYGRTPEEVAAALQCSRGAGFYSV